MSDTLQIYGVYSIYYAKKINRWLLILNKLNNVTKNEQCNRNHIPIGMPAAAVVIILFYLNIYFTDNIL